MDNTDLWPQRCCDCGDDITYDQSWTHYTVCGG